MPTHTDRGAIHWSIRALHVISVWNQWLFMSARMYWRYGAHMGNGSYTWMYRVLLSNKSRQSWRRNNCCVEIDELNYWACAKASMFCRRLAEYVLIHFSSVLIFIWSSTPIPICFYASLTILCDRIFWWFDLWDLPKFHRRHWDGYDEWWRTIWERWGTF